MQLPFNGKCKGGVYAIVKSQCNAMAIAMGSSLHVDAISPNQRNNSSFISDDMGEYSTMSCFLSSKCRTAGSPDLIEVGTAAVTSIRKERVSSDPNGTG